MITVAIVTPLRFLETIQKVITDHDFDCAFRSYTYDSLTDIDEIYAECKDSCDIILFSGELGYHYMHRHYPDCPIPCFFTVYSIADVLSILLQFHLRHPDVALNRLYLDFLTPQNNYLNIQDCPIFSRSPYTTMPTSPSGATSCGRREKSTALSAAVSTICSSGKGWAFPMNR